MIPTGLIFVWSGTHASIPAGYERETSLDNKYPKGTADATDPNTTGGSTTHSHSATANHSHTMNSHTHTYSLAAGAATGSNIGTNASGQAIIYNHTHTGTSGAAIGGDLSSVASTYASVPNDPPYTTVIFIKSTGASGVPDGGIAFVDDEAEIPSGWQFCDGSNGSPDYRNKYLKGANTGANAGGTGGSTSNTHDLIHTHTVASHTHAAANSGASGGQRGGTGSSRNSVQYQHVHSVALNAETASISATAPSLATSETVEPAFTKLVPVQNQKGLADAPLKIIGLWLGTLASIPGGWKICDGQGLSNVDMRGRHLKCGNATTEAGDTGGSNTHTHASQTHTHTASGTHTHTGNTQSHSNQNIVSGGGDFNRAIGGTSTHAVTSVQSITATYANGSTSADSQNNEPEYRTVAFIKLLVHSGGFIMLL